MNFLIISLARSGSTTLQKSIANAYGLTEIFEPYAKWGNKKYNSENAVVKVILHQIDNIEYRLGDLNEEHFQRCVDFQLKLIPSFDKIILLTRKNTKEQAESLYSLYEGNVWNAKYVYNLSDDIEHIIDQIELENLYLNKISEITNIPIDTYEEVYYGDGLIDKSILLDYDILNKKNKYRQFEIDKKLI